MGKLMHKLIQGILPSCLFTSFLKPKPSSRRLPYLKLRQPSTTSTSPSPSSSSLSTAHMPAAYLLEIEQSTYYYSYSDDDRGNLSMAGHGNTSPVGVQSFASSSPQDNISHQCYLPKKFHHHHSRLCQQHEDDQQQYADDATQYDREHGKLKFEHDQHQKPRREGHKRKSLHLDEGDDEFSRNVGSGNSNSRDDNGDWHWNGKPKRQKRVNVSCELPKSISDIVGRGSAIVQYSNQEPYHAFWESMVDMIVSNGLWDVNRQESLLLCYLTLNDPNLYATICASFLQALKDIHSCLFTLEEG